MQRLLHRLDAIEMPFGPDEKRSVDGRVGRQGALFEIVFAGAAIVMGVAREYRRNRIRGQSRRRYALELGRPVIEGFAPPRVLVISPRFWMRARSLRTVGVDISRKWAISSTDAPSCSSIMSNILSHLSGIMTVLMSDLQILLSIPCAAPAVKSSINKRIVAMTESVTNIDMRSVSVLCSNSIDH